MDEKIAGLLILAVAASGCGKTTGNGTGVAVKEFKISDTSLSPNQQARLEATVVNYNEAPTTVESSNITIYNQGPVKILEKNCSPERLDDSREGFNPKMRCTWTIKAPGESYVRGFNSKPLSLKLRLRYTSTAENSEPMKVNFQPIGQIESSTTVRATAKTGDIKVSMNTESPSTLENNQVITIKAQNTGPGSLVGNYSFRYTPSEIFNCPTEEDPIRGKVEFSCSMNSEVTGTRNIFIATSYKYEKSPNLDIKVVNN